jgi:ankyrin repeat protein
MGGCGSKVEPPITDVTPGPAASRDQSVLTGTATDNDSVPQLTLSTDSATGGSELYNLCNKAKGSQDEAWNDVLKHLKSMSHRKRTKAAQEKAMGTFTPLAAACCRQPSLEVVKALVEAAPDTVTDVGNFGNTILHMALEGVASEEVILYLIEQGALGNTGDDAGLNNPSLSASGASAIVSQNGDASFDMLENGHGKTPLVLALEHGYSLETVEALLEANGSDNAEAIIKNPDLEGCTPLHHAIQGNASLEVIQFLVEKAGKSIIEVKDSKNLTPFDIAQTHDASQNVKDYLGSKVSWQSIPWIATSSETRLRVPRTIDHGPGPTNSYRGHLQCGHGPEYWGITIEQLELIYKHPMLNSIQENDKDDEDIVLVESELTGMDSDNGDQLSSKASRVSKAQTHSTPTSYPSIRAVVDKIITPATSETGLGYALTLNQDEPLLAQTVVSHAWDQPINELIDTLKDSGKEGPFWISAFSMYQNEEEEEDLMSTAMSAAASMVSGNIIMSGKDFQYGAFCTAMKEAKNMISILTASCDYYSRLW